MQRLILVRLLRVEGRTRAIEGTVADWTQSREKLDNLRLLQARAEHSAKQEAAWKALRMDADLQLKHWQKQKSEFERQAAVLSNDLAPDVRSRVDALQSTFNRTLAASNLPPAQFEVTTGSAGLNGARYNPGTGKIEVSPELLWLPA